VTTGISAASLVLALLIMIRDRQKEQRHQVEAVGTWTVLDETSMTVTLHVCNTNPLPIFAVDIVVGLMWNDRDIERPPWAPSALCDRYAMWQSRRTTHWDDERTFHWSAPLRLRRKSRRATQCQHPIPRRLSLWPRPDVFPSWIQVAADGSSTRAGLLPPR
jgi:hypothetical protein